MRIINAPRKQLSNSVFQVIYTLLLAIGFVLAILYWTSCDAKADESAYSDYIEKVCKKDCVDPELLRMAIYRSSIYNDIEPSLLMAVFQAESGFKAKATNRTSGKSVGLAQIQIYWHKQRFITSNYYDVFDNSRVGGMILAECFQRHHGNRLKALWCYNGHQKHGMKRYALKVEKIYQSIKSKKFFT